MKILIIITFLLLNIASVYLILVGIDFKRFLKEVKERDLDFEIKIAENNKEVVRIKTKGERK